MSLCLVPRSDLTPGQLEAVRLPMDRHEAVLGPAGSGKTQVLIHRGARLAEDFHIPPSRYRFLVSSEMAAEFIRPAVREAGLSPEAVTTFDHWCRALYETHISKDLPRVYVNLRLDHERVAAEVLRLLKEKNELRSGLNFVMVDDGQDWTPEAYDVIGLAARHITAFADFEQKVNERGIQLSELGRALNLGGREIRMEGNFRNDPQIIRLADHLLPEEARGRAQISEAGRKAEPGKARPLCYIAPNPEKETDYLAARIQMREAMGEKVGILVPSGRQLHALAKDLRERGVGVEKVIVRDDQNVIHDPFDFGNDLPKITTYPASRGLEFDSVFLPHLTEGAFHSLRADFRKKLLYSAIVRAKRWVYLSSVQGAELKEMGLFSEAEAAGHLTII